MEAPSLLETGFAAVLLAATFVVGERTHILGRLLTPRSLTSFGGGMAAAYVFLHVMPELHGARHAFTEAAAMALPYEGKAIYYLALAGFLSFYGIRHFHTRQLSAREGKPDRLDFQVQIGGFAAYAWLMGYLLLRGLEAHHIAIGLYAVAMAFHCLAINRELSHEYGDDYYRSGRFILAGHGPRRLGKRGAARPAGEPDPAAARLSVGRRDHEQPDPGTADGKGWPLLALHHGRPPLRPHPAAAGLTATFLFLRRNQKWTTSGCASSTT